MRDCRCAASTRLKTDDLLTDEPTLNFEPRLKIKTTKTAPIWTTLSIWPARPAYPFG